MKHLISISEPVGPVELPNHDRGEVYASAEGEYDAASGILCLQLDSTVLAGCAAADIVKPAWLPAPQSVKEHVALDEATALARDIFRHWVETVRRDMRKRSLPSSTAA